MPDGRIGFADKGVVIDWVVVMRRFEQSSLFDALAQTGALSARLMTELAGHLADFHEWPSGDVMSVAPRRSPLLQRRTSDV